MLQYSKTGEQLTERFEGIRLTAYRDQVGVLTIGYGHTGSDVYDGLTITQEQAEELLLKDTQHAVDVVNNSVKVQLSQSMFDSLVDFVFNLGSGNFSHSTLLALVNQGRFTEAAQEFDKWDHAGGRVVAGLLRRRQAETDEFMSGIQNDPGTTTS